MAAKGASTGKGAALRVRKSSQKKGKGKGQNAVSAEKRIDPSDGNGPFTHASFLKYHGEDKGEKLWQKAGKLGKGAEKDQAAKLASGPTTKDKTGTQGGKKGKGKKERSDANDHTTGQNPFKNSKKNNVDSGAKGKGKAKNKSPAEKRLDPSDGNGPFTKASFIKFHGDELGLQLWEQAGELMDD